MAKGKKGRSEHSKIGAKTGNENGLEPGEDQEEHLEFDFIEPEEIPRNIDNSLKDFLSRNKLLEREYKVSLYKYEHPKMGQKKALQFQYFDETPTEHDVGLTYGSGRYLIIVGLNDESGKYRTASCKFNIAEHYDQLKAEREKAGIPTVQTTGIYHGHGGGGAASISAGLNTVKEVIAMIVPLLNQKQQSNNNPIEFLGESYQSINRVLMQSMMDNTQMVNDALRKQLDLTETFEGEDETTGIMGVINTLSPILEKMIPYILGGGKDIAAIKNNPLYGTVIKDKKTLKALADYIEKNHGKDSLNKVLAALKIKKPV